jgi:hypothetical protein
MGLARLSLWPSRDNISGGRAGWNVVTNVDPNGDRLFDRIRNHLVLLVLTADRSVEHAFAAEATARALPFTIIHLTHPAVRALYGSDDVLIRPDQHVAGVARTCRAAGLPRYWITCSAVFNTFSSNRAP